jgi:peptidoglycan/xylan/chitin deacetylase (PgdA/CDA1 family)
MYHRFTERSQFAAQCEHLKRYYRPISLTELGQHLQKNEPIPPNAVVVTIDDGYRDFYQHAYPVLKSSSIPAIVFLATDMLDNNTCLWVDEVGLLFRASPLRQITLDLPEQGPTAFDLTSSDSRQQAASRTKQVLKRVTNQERLEFLARLPALLETAPEDRVAREYEPLRWDEVREMAAHGIEFGAHTKSHPILSRLTAREQIYAELAGSRQRIEAELGAGVRHFCYPNGRVGDFTEETVDVVKECGFETATTAQIGMAQRGGDRYRLRRLHQEPWYDVLKFAHRVAGFGR